MKKLFPVTGWMFGMNISYANIETQPDNTVKATYYITIGYMAKRIIESKVFNSIDDYLLYCDQYLTALYCNAYLTNEERINLNKLDIETASALAFLNAKQKFSEKTAIDYLHNKITLKIQ